MLTTIAHYDYPHEAHIARAKLESEGIPAVLADEQTITMQWLYAQALGGVKLQVPASAAETALALLAEDRSHAVDQEQGITSDDLCPACQSRHLSTHTKGKRVAFLVFLGLDFPLFPVSHYRQCDDCGHIIPSSTENTAQ
ncbi:putative signal transducing protein [Neptunomonas marina]|uniref:putative signal transducing protein n=1 Tax=Neptunomonas marina TaxID=1815562 RepID=UPI00197DEC71|nr:DUF2007 domain-containing protein [Neptunomonas marina]